LPAADTAVGQDVLDTAELVLDYRRCADDSAVFFLVHNDHDDAKHGQLIERNAVEPTVVVEHDLVAVRNDVIVVRHDVRFCAPKNQLAFVTEVADGRAPHRARGDAHTGACRLDEASGCAEAMQVESGTSGELRSRQRRPCVHWIRVRTCARAEPGQHRRLRSNALAASFQVESVVGLAHGSPRPN
jgi:hypothetical protein